MAPTPAPQNRGPSAQGCEYSRGGACHASLWAAAAKIASQAKRGLYACVGDALEMAYLSQAYHLPGLSSGTRAEMLTESPCAQIYTHAVMGMAHPCRSALQATAI